MVTRERQHTALDSTRFLHAYTHGSGCSQPLKALPQFRGMQRAGAGGRAQHAALPAQSCPAATAEPGQPAGPRTCLLPAHPRPAGSAEHLPGTETIRMKSIFNSFVSIPPRQGVERGDPCTLWLAVTQRAEGHAPSALREGTAWHEDTVPTREGPSQNSRGWKGPLWVI